MTAKLKKKLKLIGLTASTVVTIGVVILASLTAKSSDLFSVPANAEETTTNKSNVQILGDTVVCDSLVQGVRDVDLPDGTYTFRVIGKTSNGEQETKDYLVEFKNEYNDVVYTSNQNLGDNSQEYKTLVVKYHKNLTINSGVTVTANTSKTRISNVDYQLCYKKGMYLCVMGKLTNNGTISMTARGTYNQAGENVYLWKNQDNTFEYIPAVGGAGLPKYQPYYNGGQNSPARKGTDGTVRGTGGGAQGGIIINGLSGSAASWMGASTGGTSYSGGNATGALIRTNSSAVAESATQATMTKGGNAHAYNGNSSSDLYFFAGGGAGIIGGTSTNLNYGTTNTYTNAENGTGGLLVIYAESLDNNGMMSSNGSKGASATYTPNKTYTGGAGGGGSGRWFCKYICKYCNKKW